MESVIPVGALIIAIVGGSFVAFCFYKADRQRRERIERDEAEREVEREAESLAEQVSPASSWAVDPVVDWGWPNTPLTPDPPFNWEKDSEFVWGR